MRVCKVREARYPGKDLRYERTFLANKKEM
jgi:hypothetical protein